MSINWKKSSKLNNMSINELKEYLDKYKHSGKKVIRICNRCNEEKEIYYDGYRDLCKSCAMKVLYDNPLEYKKRSIIQKKSYKENPDRAKNHARIMKEIYKDPLKRERQRQATLERYKDPLEREKTSIRGKEFYSDIKNCERQSAILQGQDYEAGEWTGWADKTQPHLIPISKCFQINERFSNSVGHHITYNIVIFIPEELHRKLYHNMKTNQGMLEMNILAFQFLNGRL